MIVIADAGAALHEMRSRRASDTRKDHMHFQDESILEQLKTDQGQDA